MQRNLNGLGFPNKKINTFLLFFSSINWDIFSNLLFFIEQIFSSCTTNGSLVGNGIFLLKNYILLIWFIPNF